MIAADQSDQLALDLHAIGSENAGLIGRVGSFKRNRRPLAAEPLQGCFLIVDQGDDDLAGLALFVFRMMTVSPSRMPASIIESP